MPMTPRSSADPANTASNVNVIRRGAIESMSAVSRRFTWEQGLARVDRCQLHPHRRRDPQRLTGGSHVDRHPKRIAVTVIEKELRLDGRFEIRGAEVGDDPDDRNGNRACGIRSVRKQET